MKRSRTPRRVLPREQVIAVFLDELQSKYPRTSFRFHTLRRILQTRYENMNTLVNSILKHPHRLIHDRDIILGADGKPHLHQTGQIWKVRLDFWEYVANSLQEDDLPMMTEGSCHLLANALVNWSLEHIKQQR